MPIETTRILTTLQNIKSVPLAMEFVRLLFWKCKQSTDVLKEVKECSPDGEFETVVSVLANLSFNNLEVAKTIMNANAVPAVEAVMQNQLDQMSLLSKCLTTLSNLMFSNDEHTRIICKSCGD